MTMTRRPRVAVIGLTDAQFVSIRHLCGEPRRASTLNGYLERFSSTETDLIVSGSQHAHSRVDNSVNLMAIGRTLIYWADTFPIGAGAQSTHFAIAESGNRERELEVSPACPEIYRPLAVELSRQLGQASEPPDVISTTRRGGTALIETTSGHPVALRLNLPARSSAVGCDTSSPIALLLPEISNLAAWFRAFLFELHESDPVRFPHAPARLSQPSDWYTPQERVLADRISKRESEIERLSDERDQLQRELVDEGVRADRGPRRALWSDGDELTAAVSSLLAYLGFQVRDMDAGLEQGEPKREDLRLTLQDNLRWEAIVEVKGYSRGTRRNDSRQIREHRERYLREKGRAPDLTVWISNPFREIDPSSRPGPSQDISEAADIVGAVCVLASDLYRQWVLVKAGKLDAKTVVQSLKSAEPGLWTPQVAGSGL